MIHIVHCKPMTGLSELRFNFAHVHKTFNSEKKSQSNGCRAPSTNHESSELFVLLQLLFHTVIITNLLAVVWGLESIILIRSQRDPVTAEEGWVNLDPNQSEDHDGLYR